jgi:uncharacterized membrane protein YdbT with pleckstrin-like domain
MPVIACPDCGRDVSPLAPACPHCGRPSPGGNAPIAAPNTPAQERTLWRGSPSAIVLAGYIATIVATLIVIPVAARFFGGTIGDIERGRNVARVGWMAALVLAAIEIVLFLVAFIRLRSTSYTVTSQRVMIEQGVFAKTVDEVDLRYIEDSLFHQSFGDRILGIGSVTLISSDKTTPRATLRSIRKPREVREMIRAEAYQTSQRQVFTRAT